MTSRNLIRTVLALLTILIPTLLLACGDSGGLSRADIQQIVQSELANNPAPVDQGSSRQQVEQIVGASMPSPRKSTPDEFTRYFVNSAIDRYESEGLDATLAYYNTSESMDGPWYVFIFDEDDTMLAHAAIPSLVNGPASNAVGPNGFPAGEAVAAVADEDGEWFSYTYPNPDSGAIETKHSWMVRHDGLLFGSGWYERGPRKSDPAAYTQSFVKQAVNLYDAVGLEDAIAYYNTQESVDGQWYMFILDEDDTMLAHAANPALVNRPASAAVGPNGYPAGEAVTAVADEDGAWFGLHLPQSGHRWRGNQALLDGPSRRPYLRFRVV